MNDDDYLFLFSSCFTLLILAIVLLPYFRGSTSLLTVKNLFLVGSAVFVGFSGMDSAISGHFYYYDRSVYVKYYFAIVVFYGSVLIGYKFANFAERSGHRKAISWPIVTNHGSYIILLMMLATMLLDRVATAIPGVSSLLRLMGTVGPAYAIVIAYSLWSKGKTNLITWLVLGTTFLVVLSSLIYEGGGRRGLYGSIFAIPFCLYWNRFRKSSPYYVLIIGVSVLLPAVIFDSAYYHVRWQGKTLYSDVKVESASDRLSLILQNIRFDRFSYSRLLKAGQTGVEYSLLSISLHDGDNSTFPVKPFHSIYALITAPIPRSVWVEKPNHLGNTLPFDAGTIPLGTDTNIGPGIAGHCFHEGGVHMAAFYGLLVAVALRFLDSILIARYNDPLFMGFLSSSAFHFVGWSRGAIFSFTLSPLLSYALLIVIFCLVRWLGFVEKRPRMLSRKYRIVKKEAPAKFG